MRKVVLLLCVASSLVSQRALSEEQPNLDHLRLYKPTFLLKNGENHEAGTAFALSRPNGTYAVTAHHLFGKAGGFEKQLTVDQIESEISSVQLRNMSTGESEQAGQYVKIEGVTTTTFSDGASRDIAIFQHYSASAGLTLSDEIPKAGDRVWLLAKSKDAADTDLAHSAEVIFASDTMMLYKFTKAGLNLRATSGAPVVDKNGNVVAINTAGIAIPYLLKIGIGGPVVFLKENISAFERTSVKN